jgi:hypothetical protein
MTVQQPEYYLVTRDELADIMAFGCVRDSPVSKTIATRPHPPAPAPSDLCDRCNHPEPDTCGKRPEDCSRPHPSETEDILKKLCRCDLYDFACGFMEAEDVHECKGETCNWCGRYNK